MKAVDDVDAKAATIIGYVAGGTGLVTVGSVAGLSGNTVSVWSVVAAIPAVAAAIVAMICALRCRAPFPISYPPTTAEMVKRAVSDGSEEETKRVLIDSWGMAENETWETVAAKSPYVEAASWYLGWAAVLLALPIVVAITLRMAV